MKIIVKIITAISAFVLMLSICSIDSDSPVPIIAAFVSGGWLACVAVWQSEKENEKKRRMREGW